MVYEDLATESNAELEKLKKLLEGDLPAFNKQVRDANIPAVEVRERRLQPGFSLCPRQPGSMDLWPFSKAGWQAKPPAAPNLHLPPLGQQIWLRLRSGEPKRQRLQRDTVFWFWVTSGCARLRPFLRQSRDATPAVR